MQKPGIQPQFFSFMVENFLMSFSEALHNIVVLPGLI
jgi:hypothetical protein